MIDQVLQAKNLYRSYRQVVVNKGSSGIDGMTVHDLDDFRKEKQSEIALSILHHRYRVQAIKGVEIPKSNGKTRLLGVPTVIDRWLQQAVARQLSAKFELDFAEESYGFRRGKNAQQAVLKSLDYINDGYQAIVDIDLKSFFDEVQHYKVLQLIYNRVKCPTTLWLIRKWLRAPILIDGRLRKRRKGVPQGGPLSPLLSNILLDQLDQYLKSKGLRFIRYADDFSIYLKSKADAVRVDKEVKRYLAYYLDLPVNAAKSGIRRPVNFEVLGFGFVPSYEKGGPSVHKTSSGCF